MSPDLRLRWAPAPRAGGRAQRRAVAWMLLRELAGGDIGIDNPCPRCGGPHGPVRLSGTTLHGENVEISRNWLIGRPSACIR